MTQLSRERLEEIKYRAETQGINAGYQPEEILAMVNRLLAAEAQIDEVARQAGIDPAVAEAYMQGYHDSESRKPAQPVAVPDVLLSAMEEVLRISDRDHEAWHRARDGMAAYRAAMLNAEPVNPEFTTQQVAVPDDTRRMDWLVSKTVDVREPLVYGSRSLFWSQTISDDWEEEHKTTLREQIDAAIAGEQPPPAPQEPTK